MNVFFEKWKIYGKFQKLKCVWCKKKLSEIRGDHFGPAREADPLFGRVLGRMFRPAGRAGHIFLLWAGFGQAKNNFLVYFLARPVLARKSPLI